MIASNKSNYLDGNLPKKYFFHNEKLYGQKVVYYRSFLIFHMIMRIS